MAKDPAAALAEAEAEVRAEYDEVRENLGELHVAYQAVLDAGPEDNLHDLLAALENEAKAARDGGLVGSGANDHRRALKKLDKARKAAGGAAAR